MCEPELISRQGNPEALIHFHWSSRPGIPGCFIERRDFCTVLINSMNWRDLTFWSTFRGIVNRRQRIIKALLPRSGPGSHKAVSSFSSESDLPQCSQSTWCGNESPLIPCSGCNKRPLTLYNYFQRLILRDVTPDIMLAFVHCSSINAN